MIRPGHECDAQARAGMYVIVFMGSMGLLSIGGLLWLVGGAKATLEVAVVAVLGGAVQGAMTGLPALMARMGGGTEVPAPPTGEPHDPIHMKVGNTKEEAVPTTVEEPEPTPRNWKTPPAKGTP